jgi:hypothetical protein
MTSAGLKASPLSEHEAARSSPYRILSHIEAGMAGLDLP